MSFENEQYEYIHEAYGIIELYAIYKVLNFFCIYNATSRYIDSLYQYAHRFFSSGGTCTLLPSFLGVHPNFWGCNVPSNSSFGGTKKMNCIFSTQGHAPCCFL